MLGRDLVADVKDTARVRVTSSVGGGIDPLLIIVSYNHLLLRVNCFTLIISCQIVIGRRVEVLPWLQMSASPGGHMMSPPLLSADRDIASPVVSGNAVSFIALLATCIICR